MSKFGKWVGGGLGWAFAGPIGAIIGFAIGSVIDDTKVVTNTTGIRPQTKQGDFTSSLLVLCAAVMRADGKVLKVELDFVKAFFVRHFGIEHTQQQMLVLREILKNPIPLNEVCAQIKSFMDYNSRVQLVHILFGIAAADGRVEHSELDTISNISSLLGISTADFLSIKAMFIKNNDSDFQILEIENNVTDEEVKKAYRKMAIKFHPDKVAHLGEDYRTDAEEKFKKVQEAYDNIKKQRCFN